MGLFDLISIRIENLIININPRLCRREHLEYIHRATECIIEFCVATKGQNTSSYDSLEAYYHPEQVRMLEKLRGLFASVIGLDEGRLHSTIKHVISNKFENGEVWTIARTQEDLNRLDIAEDSRRIIGKNSSLSALAGCGDSNGNNWRYRYPCFCCNNFVKYDGKIIDSRKRRADFYNSTLVFPLRHRIDSPRPEIKIRGFLTFDSRDINVFKAVPDSFEYQSDFRKYEDRLTKSPVFQVGATIADVLATTLILQDN